MDLCGLLQASKKRVLIDSSLQHMSAAMNLKSTILWVMYYQFENNIHERPYMKVSEIFDVNNILNKI